jgi:mono/diheme cytochrome c family protein
MAASVTLFGLAGCTAQHKPGPAQFGFFFNLERTSFWLRAPRVQDPLPANADMVDAGHSIYSNQCSVCHNADGKGTVLGLSMYPPATDLTSQYAQGYSDRELYYLLWNGVGHSGMPKWDTQLQPNQVWQVMHFLRTMPGKAKPSPGSEVNSGAARSARLAQGRQLFETKGCTNCHSIDNTPSDDPNLTYEGDRGRSHEWLVGHLITPPAYSPGSEMPSFGKLSGDQLDSLAVFLNSLMRGTTPQNRNSGG